VALPGNRVLVLADLPAEATARLARAVVSDASGAAHEARFAGTLSEFGGLMLALDKPLGASVRLSTVSVADVRCRMLVKAHVAMVGSERVAHYWHGRVLACEPGYRGVLYPHAESDESDLFFFTLEGELLALPLAERRPPAAQHDDSYDAAAAMPSAAVAVLAPVLADPAAHLDTSNVPRSEEEESRIAWMGVVLQPLDRELARANGVADQTDDGASGALVAYVYPGSPAAKAGIQAGMVLLRIEATSQSRPIKVKIERESWEEPFPWDQLDDVPDEYLDRIPAPWPVEENDFNRTLTELGFGEKYRVEFVGKGGEFGRDFVVSESPPHYGSAPRWKSEKLGITVRDLTYEVRRHYQKTLKDPGIIVSRVEPGSRAAVAGLRPYELITHVDGEAVTSAAEFGALVAKAREVKLSVERMSRMRQVRIAM
jgi:serine protease Do